ncbi:MAG: aspartyl/asparaginyl beta-hydroxylase domain-containing protein [Myxococcota bacterium]|nr:aspartyl/asparaginyl beta-hydroxylase domain-containing protein [Myxococcota bacterium]
MADSWFRRTLMRIGKRVRKPINGVLSKDSLVGDPEVFDPHVFPWAKLLEGAYPAIKKEAGEILAARDRLPPLYKISPDHKRIADDHWRSFFLRGYGVPVEKNCARCPETMAVLEQIPGLMTAFFSVMAPGTHLPRHKGVSKAIVTAHLPLFVPDDPGCRIDVMGKVYRWEEGRMFVFDDTFKHEVWNDTDQERVVLLMHIHRPLKLRGRLLGKTFLGAIQMSPYIKDAKRNQDAWQAELDRIDAEQERLSADRL